MTVVQHEGSYGTETWTIISMEEAKRTDRDGAYRVEWTEQLELDNTIQIELPGIPKPVSVISPKMLNARFPSRIRMQFHPSWQKLRDDLYDRTKTDYTHRELFQINQYDSILWRATGLYLEMPTGIKLGMWEGDLNVLEGVSEHKEFWKEYHKKYDAWVGWGESLRRVVMSELKDLTDDERTFRSYDDTPPSTESSLQKLGDRVRAKMALRARQGLQSTRNN